MTDAPNNNHDRLHAAVSASAPDYAELSRTYAEQGDTRLAVLAAWAADVQALQSLLWDSGLGAAADPDAELAAVAEAVDSSLRAHAAGGNVPVTARVAVETARAALTAAFDESVHALLAERFNPLDHLDGLEPTPARAAESAMASRLDGRSVETLVADLRVTAADCMAVSKAMSAAGEHVEALSQARLADMASFEAYLLDVAITAGDTTLVTVELRWQLARAAIADSFDEFGDLAEGAADLRERLVRIVGPAEEPALRAGFEPVR